MLIFCDTQTTVERQYFCAMKKHITWDSAQIGSLRWQKPRPCTQAIICLPHKTWSECNVIDRFIGTMVEWSEYCALLDAVRRLRVVRNSTENLH